MQAVARSQRLRAAGNWLPEPAFRMRKEYFSDREEGLFSQEPRTRPMHEAMVTDPSFMTEMMKRNLTGVVPQVHVLAAHMVERRASGGLPICRRGWFRDRMDWPCQLHSRHSNALRDCCQVQGVMSFSDQLADCGRCIAHIA